MRLRVVCCQLRDGYMFNFEKLELWQKAIDFADLLCKETQAFPSEERFGLTNQPRRADDEQLSRMLSGLRKSLHSTLNLQL